ncbi:MAG TPA: AarF/ABC1/UbiB kinase family protein, partial [Longimicrobiales bacterium]|nr:AarF/ABC1/UbiB kinase family protein [Longimicrobiales bacterium]
LEALSRLQDDVEPFPYEQIEPIVAEELGVRISKAFESFEEKPFAAASLGQVHRATLRDGRHVVVKVQRPGIREQVLVDLEAMAEIAGFLDRHTETGERMGFRAMVEEFGRTLMSELDYRREAANLRAIGANLERFESIVVPRPVDDYTTSRVLTMDYVPGTNIDALSPVVKVDLDGERLADELFEAYLQQILVDGLFHADPHPGNVLLTRDRRIALLDLGMVGRIDGPMQERLLRLLLALADLDSARAADVALSIGRPLDGFDPEPFRRGVADLVAKHGTDSVQQVEVGRAVLQLTRLAADHGVRMPHELTVLGKTLLNLDAVGRTLAPTFQPNAAIRRHANDIMGRRMNREASLSQLLSVLLDGKEFIRELPGRLNRTLDLVANNHLRIKVDSIDEAVLLVGLLKVANRITAGLVLAAVIVSAALMMQTDTAFTVFGYPGIAMLFFLAASAGAFWLVWSILWTDRDTKDRASREQQ